MTKKIRVEIRERPDGHDVRVEEQDSKLEEFWKARQEGERNCGRRNKMKWGNVLLQGR